MPYLHLATLEHCILDTEVCFTLNAAFCLVFRAGLLYKAALLKLNMGKAFS